MLRNEKRSAVTTADLRFAQKSQDQAGLVGVVVLGALVGLPPPQPTRGDRHRARTRTARIRFIENSSVSVTTTLRE
jgi:hypothetical protein